MISSQKIFTKLRLVLYDHFFTNSIFGYNKRTKRALDSDFENGKWDFLEAPSEKGRYDNIINLYKELKPEGSILDIGCGQGVLYKYMQEVMGDQLLSFCGIDISEKAIEMAKASFTGIDFRVMDFEKETLNEKFDVIIFNETLYYFAWPIKILQKCFKENVKPGGIIIVSMHDYHGRNNRIWTHILQNYTVVGEETATNTSRQTWDAKALKPKEI